MTELIKIMQQRQSCRKFTEKNVEDEKIVACINAASIAPSAGNSQPYHFYVANTEDSAAAIAANVQIAGMNKWTESAKAFVVITQEHANLVAAVAQACHRDFRQYDIGLALENFLLEATELGLGTCVLGIFNEEKIKEKFRIPNFKKIALVIAIGYPESEEAREKKRRPLEESITYLK